MSNKNNSTDSLIELLDAVNLFISRLKPLNHRYYKILAPEVVNLKNKITKVLPDPVQKEKLP